MSGTGARSYSGGLPMVNRHALVLEPTEAYLDWANSCPGSGPTLAPSEPGEEETGEVYLIPELDAGPEAWLREHYLTLFEHELWEWCTDEDCWPPDRSFQAFTRFFRVRFFSMVSDLSKEPITREGP